MKHIIRQIPNTITLLNLLSGVMATFFAIDGHLTWAGIFICAASIFDFLDGLAARALKAYSEIGKELDSLSDLVSFGVAPGAILFTLMEYSLFGHNQPIYEIEASMSQWLYLSVAFLLPIFGAIRLAKFNVAAFEKPFFLGLPIPSNGIFWASMGLILEFPKYQEQLRVLYSPQLLAALGIFMAAIMVSNLPMFSLKVKNLSLQSNWYRYLFLALTGILLACFQIYGFALLIPVYILLNTIFYLLHVKF